MLEDSNELLGDILIVDDTLENIRFLSDFLSAQRYQVRKAINGQGALMAAKALPPDLILLDINMPGMGGYEVCEKLKADLKTSSIPIIFLSAGNDISDKVQAFQVGGVDYITKPFQLEEVLVRIKTQLQLKVLQEKLQSRNQQLQETISRLEKTQTDLQASESELKVLFQGMTELVSVIDYEGHYIKLATPHSKLIYKPDEERIGKKLHDILPEKQADILLKGIQNALETHQTIQLEYNLILEQGKTELCANLSPISANTVLCVVRDISERKRREEALQLIVEGTASKTGSEFFRCCVRYLAKILEVNYTFVTESANLEKTKSRTLAFWSHQTFTENFEYDLEGTPCHEVVKSGSYKCYNSNLRNRFNTNQALVEWKAESYAGMPLIGSDGGVIGHLAVVSTNPLPDNETTELVLKIFAARAGAELERLITDVALQESQEESERLLLNILPSAIAQRLKKDTRAIAEHFDQVTILFADIVGFTPLSTRLQPTELVNLLNEIFSKFDALTEKHNLEKIKTIGDAYMVAGGLPLHRVDHAEAVAQMALDMQVAIAEFQKEYSEELQIRIGINTGSAIAGVIGVKKFIYDLWGDAVNVASRMESSGLAGKIQVTEATYEQLKHKFQFEKRGLVSVKGRGEMTTYWLESPVITVAPHQ